MEPFNKRIPDQCNFEFILGGGKFPVGVKPGLIDVELTFIFSPDILRFPVDTSFLDIPVDTQPIDDIELDVSFDLEDDKTPEEETEDQP